MHSPFPALLAMLIVSSAGTAGAQSAYLWEELGSGNGLTISYNPLTVRREGNVVSFLEKAAFSPYFTTSNGQTASYYTSDLSIDCQANTVTRSNYTAYDANGNTIPGATDQNPQGTVPIEPDSGAAAFKEKFCS